MNDEVNYFNDLLKIKPPSIKENMALIEKAINGTDKDKWTLITRNIRYVRSIVSRHMGEDYAQLNDMMIDGLMGFYEATTRLKPSVFSEFMVYCGAWIEREIITNLHKRQSAFNSKSERSRFVTGGIPEETIKIDHFGNRQFGDALVDITQSSPSEICEENDVKMFARKFIEEICFGKSKKWFTNKERQVLWSWIFNNGNGCVVAKRAGLSKQRVAVILDRIVVKIHRHFANKNIEFPEIYGNKGRVNSHESTMKKNFKYILVEIDEKHRVRLEERKENPYSNRLFKNKKNNP